MPEEIHAPKGFRFAAVEAGLRKAGGPDVALIVSDAPASAAATFTSNLVKAAPVVLSAAHLRRTRGRARAIVVNAGNANCATPGGMQVATSTAQALAALLRTKTEQVLVASTGVIGVPLPVGKLMAALPGAVAALSATKWSDAAAAILTTDTRPKISWRKCGKARVLGFAKGAGMIQPRMTPHATMLAFIVTDARITPAALQKLVNSAVGHTFNRVSVDGDTSTNDTLFVLANGAAGAVPSAALGRALEEVMLDLAVAIAADGEGARKLVHIRVTGARHERDAETVARAIANSPLVKTAIAGGDPNWGRILSAAGNAGVPFDPGRARVTLQGVAVCRRGAAVDFDEPALGHTLAHDRDILVDVDLGRGSGRANFWTCDFTEDYVRINASYRT